MQISAALLQELTDVLNTLSAELQPKAVAIVDRIASLHAGEDGLIPRNSVAAFRADVAVALDALCSGATDIVAAHASELYDKVRSAAAQGGAYSAVAESFRDPAKTEGAIRALVETVVKTGKADSFARECASRLDYEMRRAAAECIVGNAKRDPLRPKWARVPSGAETCSFCLMLASFGANYNDRDSISHVHANCDCRMVQMYEGATVEGYDPDRAYVQTEKCLETIGGRDGLHKDWERLPEADRAKAIGKYGGSESKAFDAYVNKRLAAEMATRDAHWLRTGAPCKVSREAGAKPLPKEWRLARTLADNGFSVEFVKETNAYKVKTPDARLNGCECEFKIPERYGEKTVKNQFKKAVGKGTESLVISCQENGASVSDIINDVSAIFAGSEYVGITQVLVIGADGSMRRLKRK